MKARQRETRPAGKAAGGQAGQAAQRVTERVPVTGLDCSACGSDLRDALRRLPGILSVAVNVSGQEIAVTYDPGRLSVPAIRAHMEGIGIGCR